MFPTAANTHDSIIFTNYSPHQLRYTQAVIPKSLQNGKGILITRRNTNVFICITVFFLPSISPIGSYTECQGNDI